MELASRIQRFVEHAFVQQQKKMSIHVAWSVSGLESLWSEGFEELGTWQEVLEIHVLLKLRPRVVMWLIRFIKYMESCV